MRQSLAVLAIFVALTLPSLVYVPVPPPQPWIGIGTPTSSPTMTPGPTADVPALTTRVARLEATAVALEAAKNRLETRHGMHDGKIRALEERTSQLELWRREFVEWRERLDAWLTQVQLAWGRGR